MATSTKNSTIYRTNILIFTEKYCILTEKSEQICYLKAHTQSCLWTLMTLTVPSFSFIGFQNSFHSWCFYWDLRKMLKMKRRRKLFLASKDHLPLVKLFVLSIFFVNSIHLGQFITYLKYLQCNANLSSSGDIQSFCCWLNPRSLWHLSIHSLLAGFALRVNKGGNLINIWKPIWSFLLYFFFLSIFTKYKYK